MPYVRTLLRYVLTSCYLLMSATAIAIWPRSFFCGDELMATVPQFPGQQTLWTIRASSSRGEVDLACFQHGEWNGKKWLDYRELFPQETLTFHSIRDPNPLYYGNLFTTLGPVAYRFRSNAHEFGAQTSAGGMMRTARLRFPIWLVLILSLPLAFHGVWRIRRDRKAQRDPNLCQSCGYDLRAGHNKCPECGGESHVKVGAVDSTNTPTAPSGQR